MQFFIIIPTHNRLELTRLCLRSLSLQFYRNFKVILVDDGSMDGTSKTMQLEFSTQMDLDIIQGDGTLWWAGAVQKGIECALSMAGVNDVICLLNDDLTVEADFLTRACKVIHQNQHAVISGVAVDYRDGVSLEDSGWQITCWPLFLSRRVWWPLDITDLAGKPPVVRVDYTRGTTLFIPAGVIRRHGALNATMLPHYHADIEYTYRLGRQGVPLFLSRDLIVSHHPETTGILGDVVDRPRLGEIIRSFSSRRSVNNVRDRWVFAEMVAPRWAILPFFISGMIKRILHAAGAFFWGKRVDKLREIIN